MDAFSNNILNKADRFLKRGMVDQAHQILLPLAEKDNARAINTLARSFASDLQNFEESELWARRGVALGETSYPYFDSSLHLLALALKSQGQLVEAEKWSRNAMSAGSSVAWLTLQSLLRDQGKKTEAKQLLGDMSEHGSLHAKLVLAGFELEEGNYTRAMNLARATLEAGFFRGNSLFLLGSACAGLGDHASSISYWAEGSELGDSRCQVALKSLKGSD